MVFKTYADMSLIFHISEKDTYCSRFAQIHTLCVPPVDKLHFLPRMLLKGGQLIIMAGMKYMEWHQTHGNHLFDTIPFIAFQPLL